MKSTAIRRLTSLALGAALAAGVGLTGGVATVVTSAPEAAFAASTVGGQITPTEVLSRAKFWYDNRGSIPYNQGGYYPDQNGRNYRTDCSGFVSMAWHLSTSKTTHNMYTVSKQISKNDLQPGDVLNIASRHVILFKRWIDKSTGTFEYYAFGSTPVKMATETLTGGSDGRIDSHLASDYVARRYNNISTSGEAPVKDPGVADVTGDGYHDLVARKTDGTLWLYSNNIERDNGVPYSGASSRQIGSGWSGSDRIVNADVTGDGFTDVLLVKSDGTMILYSNNIVRDDGAPYSSSASRQVGSGWNNFDRIVGADVTGDGFTDLVARKTDGTLWLYPNNIVRDNGIPYSSPAARQIGSGWNGFDTLVGADVTGDGFTDLVARKTDGTLWMYANNIVRDNGVPYSAAQQIGSGWNGFDTLVGADVTGDGFTDLVARKTDGTLWMYANNIVRDNGVPYSAAQQIGSGWNGFNSII
ncbi:FG-GAP-like repeat-containing protein [Micromonospora coxensis]|uniref:Repeat domain-containing protein n=1 Tax=Micromonospora coxensis TaxID=356852 RepID=A0A1C5IIQ5_9ACTN|nr:FG-GAP-like repeat-containing protein [Micromonospora coxensis]SCG57919.1 Repeat domain-containing protein [Micromonospora coxensis]